MERPPGEHGLSTDQIHFLLRTPIHCNGCSTARCGLCGFSFHNGVDCQEYYAKNYVYNNTELATWKKSVFSFLRFLIIFLFLELIPTSDASVPIMSVRISFYWIFLFFCFKLVLLHPTFSNNKHLFKVMFWWRRLKDAITFNARCVGHTFAGFVRIFG